MHSIADLMTVARTTKGEVPPALVGASTTVVGNKMYLFGGRLVSLRRMVSDLYEFDMKSITWRKIVPRPDEDVPGPRYFHSTDIWNDQLVVFGGMGYVASTSDELCVLSDIRFFSLTTRSWVPPREHNTPSIPLNGSLNSTITLVGPNQDPSDPNATRSLLPRARYAHLSSILTDQLFVIGGQDMSNVWLDDIHVYDLTRGRWILRRDFPRHCGTYRSVAVSAALRVRSPMEETQPRSPGTLTQSKVDGEHSLNGPSAMMGPPGRRFQIDASQPSSPKQAPSSDITHLPYSTNPTSEFPNDIYLYSNYNFTDVRRELESFSPSPNGDFTVTEQGSRMTGQSLPPGLRFPTGAILGNHLIISGTYLAHTYQSFSVWALDLTTMAWTRIDPGATLLKGSWSRGVLWTNQNKFVIFGNKEGNLVEDYNRRLLNWNHVAYVDLEAFGIYQPPQLTLDIQSQELGLAALEEGVLADFEIVCDDGRKIKCSRKALEDRWPWFKEQRRVYLTAAAKALGTISTTPNDLPLPMRPPVTDTSSTEPPEPRPDPRLTPRHLNLAEPYPITMALLQYLYSLSLLTPLQLAPAVLSSLLVLSVTYELSHLETLVKHAMHRALSSSNAVGVYEVATLCGSQSLQLRALKVVMSFSKPRRTERADGHSGRDSDRDRDTARPRGMSDAPSRSRYAGGGELSGSTGRAINGHTHGPAGGQFHQRSLGSTSLSDIKGSPVVPNDAISKLKMHPESPLTPGMKVTRDRAQPTSQPTSHAMGHSVSGRQRSLSQPNRSVSPLNDHGEDISDNERDRRELLSYLLGDFQPVKSHGLPVSSPAPESMPVVDVAPKPLRSASARPALKVSVVKRSPTASPYSSRPHTANTDTRVNVLSSSMDSQQPRGLDRSTSTSLLRRKDSGRVSPSSSPARLRLAKSSERVGHNRSIDATSPSSSARTTPTRDATVRQRKAQLTLGDLSTTPNSAYPSPAIELTGSSYFTILPESSSGTKHPTGVPSAMRQIRHMQSLTAINPVLSHKTSTSWQSASSSDRSAHSRSGSGSATMHGDSTSHPHPPPSPMTSSDTMSVGLLTPAQISPSLPAHPQSRERQNSVSRSPQQPVQIVMPPSPESRKVPWHERIIVGPARGPMYYGATNQLPESGAKRRPSTAGGISATHQPQSQPQPQPQIPQTPTTSSVPTTPNAPTTPVTPDGGFSSRTRRFLSGTKESDAVKARKKAEKKAAEKEKEKEKSSGKHAALEGELFSLLPTLTTDRKKKLKDQQLMSPQYFPIPAVQPGMVRIGRPKTAA